MIICKKCNTQLEEDTRFCYICGTEVTPAPMPVPSPMPMVKVKTAKSEKTRKLLTKIFISAAAVALVIILAVLVPRFFMDSKAINAALYIKNGEIYYTSLSSVKPKEITEELGEESIIQTGNDIYLSNTVALSSNGKRLFYYDRIMNTGGDLTVCYQDLKSKNPVGEKIDSEISRYSINNEGNKIFYIKGTNSDLYVSDLKDIEKLDSKINTFYINTDGSKIVYINKDGNIYEKSGNKGKVKIDSHSSIVSVSENLNTIYYLKLNSLYVKKAGKDKEKILSGVTSVVHIYDSGEIYYLKSKDIKYKLSDFLNDDLAESDAAMAEPPKPLYPDYSDYVPDMACPEAPDYNSYSYDDWDLYNADFDEYLSKMEEYDAIWYDNFNAALDEYILALGVYESVYKEYNAKLYRDIIRANVEGKTLPVKNSTLYYYDTKESTVVTDTYSDYYDFSTEKPILIYSENNEVDITKINMSDIQSYDYFYPGVLSTVYTASSLCTAINSKTSVITQESGSSFYITEAGDSVYYIDDYDSTDYSGNLYEIKITDNKLGTPVKVDENIYSFELQPGSGELVYYKDVKKSAGDLYINRKLVASDVYIGDDIYSYRVISENRILYLKDYNVDNEKGDLYLYDGSDKEKEIDTDVTSIIPIYKRGYCSSN